MNRFYSLLQRAGFLLLLLGAAASTALAQRPGSLDLGQVSCGQTVCGDLRIPSLAAGERITKMTFRDGTVFDFSSTPSFPLVIPDNDAVTLSICLTASGRGSFEDSLMVVVMHEEIVGPDTTEVFDTAWVTLTGIGTGPALTVDPLQVTFPRTDVNGTSVETVVFRNDGDEVIALTAADLAGIIDPFTITNAPAFPVDIQPGDSVVVEVTFAPLLAGNRSAYTDVQTGCGQFARLRLSGRTPDLVHKGFGEVACDETVCDTLYVPATGVNEIIQVARLRDDASFTIDPGFVPPIAIPAGDSLGIPICFSPVRRGTIVDSLLVVVSRSGSGLDSIRVRLTGVGIGPLIDVSPIVLNFPKTTPPAASNLSTFFTNNGERPLTLTAADLPIPAPFRLVSPALPTEIKPGETIEIVIAFAPTESGVFSEPVDISVGCTRVLQIGLNGSTDFIGTGGVLRVSKVGFNPANDERVACDVSQCTEVTLSNVGNASLRVDSLTWANGALGYTFTPAPAIPFMIQPNETRTVQVCIDAARAGVLDDTLLIHSNDRRSIAFGIVLDASRSMILDSFLCGPNNYVLRLTEAKRQAQIFIDNTLLYLPALGIQDQIVITHFSNDPVLTYDLDFVDDVVRADARAAVGGINAIAGTWTGKALVDMIGRLQASPLPDRVIVLLADGETADLDRNNFPLNNIINQANASNIRIFAIGIGLDDPNARNYLDDLTSRTDGASFYTNDCSSLQNAFAEITEVVSQGGIWREPFRITVTAPKIVAENIRFDTLYIYDDTCVTLTLTNVGEGEALVDTVTFTNLLGGMTTEFYLEDGTGVFPMKIPENEQRQVRICFRPEDLREREGLTVVSYNDCAGVPSGGNLNGTGFAIANLRVDDERVTLPGGSVTMPIYGDTSLATYSVNTITWTVRWNRTMLELTGVAPGPEANGASVVQSGPILENGRYASVELTATGPALYSAGQLAELQFTMLRGDSLAAYVEIVQGTFEDGNPKALLKNAGIVIYDSTCFRELKPILYKGPAAKVSIGSVSPVPASGDVINVTLESTEQGAIALDLFDSEGGAVIATEHHELPKGSSLLTLKVGALRSGVYHLRLQTDGGASLYHKLIIRR